MVHDGHLGQRRFGRGYPPHLGRRPRRCRRVYLDRYVLRQRSSDDRLPASARALPAGGRIRLAGGAQHRRGGLGSGQHEAVPAQRDDDDDAGDPRRAALLAGDPCRAISRIRQRRRGVVQSDIDLDGRCLLEQGPVLCGYRVRPRAISHDVGSAGRLRGPLHIRLSLQRRGQLAVQHRIRGSIRPGRRSDTAPLTR